MLLDWRFVVLIGIDGINEVDLSAWQIVFEIADGGWPNLGPRLEWLLYCS